jgi:hypothetical protein
MKKPPEAYWTLWKVIHKRILNFLTTGIHPDMLNPVFGLPQPKDFPKGPEPSLNERYWINWFHEFTEIHASIERLDQSLVYLRHYPRSRAFRFHGLSEADWLRYHIEAYLQETYILFQRLSRFLRKIEKVAISARDKNGLSSANRLKAILDASFNSVVTVRSGHVHEYRFRDDELRNLDSLVLLTKTGKLSGLRALRSVQYVAALNKWRKQLLRNNKEIQKLCVALFEQTTKILTRNEPPRGVVTNAGRS